MAKAKKSAADSTVANLEAFKASAGDLRDIELHLIQESPFNPRKSYNQEALNELAETIKEMGLLHPILVRPAQINVTDSPEDGTIEGFEVVCGHRRFRASKIAKERTIRATVSTLSDAESARLQTIENLQREDLDPIEAAEGYADYMHAHGVTADQLAGHIKKSRTHVYNQLKLTTLCELGRKHVRTRALDTELAIEVARLPTEEMQIKALELVAFGDIHKTDAPSEEDREDGEDDGPLTFMRFGEGRTAIERELKRHLSTAIFDRQVIFLVKDRPDCQSCPERAGNMPELNAIGKRADICTNPACFDQKEKAHLAIVVEEAGKQGGTVIPPDESERLFLTWDRNRLTQNSGYLPLDTAAWQIENKTPRDALGKKLKPKDVVHIVNTRGSIIQAVTMDTLIKHKLIEEPEPEVDDEAEEDEDIPVDARTPEEVQAQQAAWERENKVGDIMRVKAYPATVDLIRSMPRQPGDITAVLFVLFERAYDFDDNDNSIGGNFDDWLRPHNEELAGLYESWAPSLAGQERSAKAWEWLSSLDSEAQGRLCLELALYCCSSDRARLDVSPDLLMTVARNYGLDEAQLRADAEAEADNPTEETQED